MPAFLGGIATKKKEGSYLSPLSNILINPSINNPLEMPALLGGIATDKNLL